MKVLLVSPFFPPQSSVASLRVHSFARALADAGEDVTVLTTAKRADQRTWPLPSPGVRVVERDYRTPAPFERLRGMHRERATGGQPRASGVSTTRLREWLDARGLFGGVRMPDLTDFWVRPAVDWACGEGIWDVVFSSGGPYTAHLVAAALRRRGRAHRWVAEFRDLWARHPFKRGLFPFTVREHHLERRCLRLVDAVVTVSEPLAETLRRDTAAPVEIIYNGFDPDETTALDDTRIFPDDGLVRLVTTGTLCRDIQDVDCLMRAMASARQSRDDGDRLRLVVASANGSVWLDAARAAGVEDLLDVRGVVPRDDARRFQRDADALVLVDFPQTPRGILTTKIFEYLSVTAPVLLIGGPPDSSQAEMVQRAARGRPLGHDADSIAGTLRRLLDGATVLDGTPDRRFIESFTRERQAVALRELLRSVHAAPTRSATAAPIG